MIQLNIVKLLVFVISGVFFLWFVSKAKSSSWLNSDCITVHPEVAGGPYFGSLLWAASALFETYPARVLVIFQMLEWPSNCVLILRSSTADVRLELSRSHVVQVEACLQVKSAQRKLTSFFQFMGKSFPLTHHKLLLKLRSSVHGRVFPVGRWPGLELPTPSQEQLCGYSGTSLPI